ncbi:MAG: hypothetical protein ACYTBP_13810 [Planctomycetota bacterium]|jgi:hypothetical protein
MNKKIEECLRATPKPQAPKNLLNRLEDNVSSTKFNVSHSSMLKWFVPTGNRISLIRVAATAIIGIVFLLPMAYGATKVIQYFTISGVSITSKSDKIITEEDVRNSLEEFGKLYREGKAKEVKPGVWVVTLSNGEEFAYGGNNPELVGLPSDEKNKLLESQSNEIQKLRKSGNFERTFIKEIEENGVKIRLYEDRFTLSSGKVVTMTYGEEQTADKKKQ